MTALAVPQIDRPAAEPAAPTANIPWGLVACCWLLMFVCFSIPGRPDVSVSSLDSIALLKLGTRVGAFVFFSFLFLKNWHPTRSVAVLKILAPTILFVGWGLLSVTWSPLKSVSLGQVSVWVVGLLLAANIGVLWRGPQDTSRILGGISSGMLFFCCFLVALNYALPQYGSLSRLGWGILHPTAAASLGGSGMMLLVASRLLWGWRWSRLQMLPGMVAYTWLLLLAQNRTSTIVTALLVVGMFCLFSNRQLFLGLTVGACLAASAMLLVDPGQRSTEQVTGKVGEHLARGQKGRLSEFSGRREMWDEVWRQHLKSPWIGHGYFVSSAGGQIYVWYTWGNWTAHNVWLQVLVGTGYVGVALFAAGIAFPGLCLLRSLTTPHARRMAWFAGAMITWYLGWGCFNESIAGPLAAEVIVFFTVLGVVVATAAAVAARETDAGCDGSFGFTEAGDFPSHATA